MDYSNYFSYLVVPDTWGSLEDFVQWYFDNKMPLRIPKDSAVFTTDNATSFPMFRQGVYQAELYVVHPKIHDTAEHFHPDLEVIICQIGAMNPLCVLGHISEKVGLDKSHGAGFRGENGAVFIAFQKWKEGVKITSASANWKGYTDGPIHNATILKHYPNATIVDGYADITKI